MTENAPYMDDAFPSNDSRNIPWYKRLVAWREARRFARKTKRAIKSTLRNFGQEAMETREMAQLFFRLLDSKLELSKRSTPPSDEEVKAAVEQLIDVARISVFASISLLPGGGFSLIGLEILARKFGIRNFTFLPSSFRKKENDNSNIQQPVAPIDEKKQTS